MGRKSRTLAAVRAKRGAAALTVMALLYLCGAESLVAGNGKWSFEYQPMYMDVLGHDIHILTIHDIDLDGSPQTDRKTAVSLDTDSGLAHRFELHYDRGKWIWGADFLMFRNSLSTPTQSRAADGPGGNLDRVVFEVADQSFSSDSPGEVLYFRVLEDNELWVWTFDFYGKRVLVDTPTVSAYVQVGVRFGDFDNDYRSVVGVENGPGSRLDASSNYDRMMGPLIGWGASFGRGKHRMEGYLGQSVIFGSTELTSMSRGFTGIENEMGPFDDEESFRAVQDAAVPITELRLKWSYGLGKHFSAGLGTNTAAWWQVPTPPGSQPVPGGDEELNRRTIVFSGIMASVKVKF